MTVRRLAARDCLQSCGLTSKGLSLCFSELNFTGCEQSRSEMERWTGTTQGTRNESCGCFGKRTPFLRLRTQLHRIRGRTLRTESLDRSNARDLAQVVRLLREVDVSPVSPSSTTGCEAERQKPRMISQCEAILLRCLSPAKFISHS